MNEFIMQETEEMTTFGSVWKRYEPVAKLVRCKDCSYYFGGGFGNVNGDSPARNLIDVEPDWFCADGERKEE